MENPIKQLMLQKGLDVHKLAKRSGINRARLSAILLDDEPEISEEEIQALAVAFETDRSSIEGSAVAKDDGIKERIRWQLGLSGRMDLFDQVLGTLNSQRTNFREAERYPISDLVIRQLINQILDKEEPGA